MAASAFACILRLYKADDPSLILAVLPAERREQVQNELNSLMTQSSNDARQMLLDLRKGATRAQQMRVQAHFKRSLDHASPRLIAWLSRPF